MTPYRVRIESCEVGAFSEIDHAVLEAFSWQLAAAHIHAERYAERVTQAQWAERRRIAADLHDAVSQRLFSAQLLARTLSAAMQNPSNGATVDSQEGGPDGGTTKSLVTRIETLLRESQEEMRGLIRALRPIEREGHVLKELRSRLGAVSSISPPYIRMVFPDAFVVEPSVGVRDALLNILDEAVHNALKHARATTIDIKAQETDDGWVFDVVDDGIGCTESDIGEGLGTRTMFERARAIGGDLTIVGTPDLGTRVCVTVSRPRSWAMNRSQAGDNR